jgi:hypothetical protein
MRIRHSGKLLAALVATAVSSAAHATIDADQIVFYAYNGSVDSVMFDLGLNLSNFPASSASTIVWDFNDNTVTGALPGGATVNYGNIWSSFSFSDASTRWGVIGADVVTADLVSTSLAPQATVANTTGTAATESSVDTTTVYMNQNNLLPAASSTHLANDNGASRATGGNALHYNGFGAFDNWQNRTTWAAGRTGSGSMPLYYIAYAEPTGTVTKYAGTMTFDAANATLTYSAASVGEIPEPSAWALVAAGALGLGGFARRRKQP